jgi:hypothetical protein
VMGRLVGTRFSIGLLLQPAAKVVRWKNGSHKNHLGGRGLMVLRFARAVLRSGSRALANAALASLALAILTMCA